MSLRRAFFFVPVLAISYILQMEVRAQDALTPVVTNCRSDVEIGNETNLSQAIEVAARKDRIVTFNCPAGTKILINHTHNIAGGMTIDGGNQVTLTQGPAINPTWFRVASGDAPLVVKNIKLEGEFVAGAADRDAAIFSDAPVILDNVVVENQAGAVKARKSATVHNSKFIGNRATLEVQGQADISQSQFINNLLATLVTGSATIKDTLYQDNKEAVQLRNGSLIFTNSTVQHNKRGLTIIADGDTSTFVRLTHNVFTGNGPSAGISPVTIDIFPSPNAATRTVKAEISYNKFLGNNSGGHGGAIQVSAAANLPVSTVIKGGIFVNNVTSGNGGAISIKGEELLITNSLFRGNSSSKAGGAIFARTKTPLIIANSLIAENISASAAVDAGTASIFNTTIARNKAIGLVLSEAGPQGKIANTIFSENQGGNCRGVSSDSFGRGNIQFGASDCAGVAVDNPFLDSIYSPSIGSRATSAGDVAVCRNAPVNGIDFVYQQRVVGQQCSSGAYERPPVRTATETLKKQPKTCPDGSQATPGLPCPEAYKKCPGGGSVPVSAACPEDMKTCPGGVEVPVRAPCPTKNCPGDIIVSAAEFCPEPPRICPGGTVVPAGQPCPAVCDPGCTGTPPNCNCPCPAPCAGTRPNCFCPCSDACSCEAGCRRASGGIKSCVCTLPHSTPAPRGYCVSCVN